MPDPYHHAFGIRKGGQGEYRMRLIYRYDLSKNMNANLERLCALAKKEECRIIGLMSGTSMDGLDIALCRFRGSGQETAVTLEAFITIPFGEEVKEEVRKVFARKEIDFQHLTLLNGWIGHLHGQLVLDALDGWGIHPAAIDLIASHGQTVFHAPHILHQIPRFGNGTLQIGDGDHLAVRTGIITLSDFRQKHIAAGGEGAPLAVYGDFLLFSDLQEPRVLLNIGGIANFTYLPAGKRTEGVFVTDCGPGNTLMDAVARQYFPGYAYDPDGAFAAAGSVHAGLLAALWDDSFFSEPVPKTTGPELFSLEYLARAQQRSNTAHLSPEDILATLNRFSAETMADSIKRETDWQHCVFYVSGGGAHNPVLRRHLQGLLPGVQMLEMDLLGIPGDAKEAVLFAVLANETIRGGEVLFPNQPSVSMGKISFPS